MPIAAPLTAPQSDDHPPLDRPPPSTGLVAAEGQSPPSNHEIDLEHRGLAHRRLIHTRHPSRDRTPKARSIRRTRPPIHRSDRRRTRASIPERQLDPEDQPPPRCRAPSIPSRIASAVESASSSAHPRCRGAVASSAQDVAQAQGVLWGSRGCGVQG
ncbi:hypothetical protein FGG24_gp97 [Mycobacterium phage JC27]|uniref:Uncharacterized protein n=1 Tax=Mycobacterium phage JC27 TaxID=2922210 RepID=G1D3E6_9CAUD|nr:hypothetical protein FGG24_gp97 [Mycobacterium phage JC27]AEK09290.1 hypothetical protein PBI_JC27_97 [Mycobacterium phage JC27]